MRERIFVVAVSSMCGGEPNRAMDAVAPNEVALSAEENRLRRKQLRRRPEMLQKAKEYGLLCDDEH